MFKFQTLIERLVTTPVENQLFEANPFQTLIERLVTDGIRIVKVQSVLISNPYRKTSNRINNHKTIFPLKISNPYRKTSNPS